MAIAVDTRNVGTKSAGATSITWTHTVNSGLVNSILVVSATTGSAVIKSITSVTWNATNLSSTVNGVAATQNDPATNTNGNLWFLRAPAAGALSVVVTPSASCELTGGSSSWQGVAQGATFNAASPQKGTAASGNSPSLNVTSASGQVVIDSTSFNEAGDIGTITVGASQNEISNQNNGVATSAGASSDEPGAATTTMSWTLGNAANSNGSGIVGISLRPALGIGFVTSGGADIATSASTWSFVPGGSSMVAGGAIVVGVGVGSSAVTVSTITDNTTNVYLKAVARGTPKPIAGAELWYALGYSTASTRVSLTLSATSSGGVAYAQFEGFSTAGALGVTGSSAITVNSTSHSASEITPTSTGVVVAFARVDVSTIGTITKDVNYTQWVSTNLVTRCFGEYQIQAAISTATGSFTTSSNAQHAAAIAVFYDTVIVGGGSFYYTPSGFMSLGLQR